MPPEGGGGGDPPRSGLRDVEEDTERHRLRRRCRGSVMALTAAVPASTGNSRISTAMPFVMPVRTATPDRRAVVHPQRAAVAHAGARGGCEVSEALPRALNIAAVGLKRRAAAGTVSVSPRRATSTVTVAVMPGFSFNAGFSAAITAS